MPVPKPEELGKKEQCCLPSWIAAIATVVLAVFAILTTIFAWDTFQLQKVANNEQFEYYKKTTRPYLCFKELNLIQISENPELYEFWYVINNGGTLPGIEVQCRSFFSENILSVVEIEGTSTSATNIALVPPKLDRSIKKTGESLSFERLREISKNHKYLHIIIKYRDFDYKLHSYVIILALNIYKKDNQISIDRPVVKEYYYIIDSIEYLNYTK